MKAIDIAIKDITRSMRSAIALAFMFGIPLLVTGMFYLMFGNIANSEGFNLPRTRLVIANLDRGGPKLQSSSKSLSREFKADTLSELVVEVLQSKEMADLLEVSLVADAETARAAVDSQQAQVAIIIPQDFSRQFADLYGQAEIDFYQDPTLLLGPGIVKSILNRFMDGLSGIKIAVDVALEQLDPSDYRLVGQVVQQFLDSSTMQSEDLSGTLLEVQTPQNTQESENPLLRIVGPIMGGMMIFYAFYTGAASAESLLKEEEERTLPRLFTTPTPQSTILGGKYLAVFLTVLVQVVVLLVAGALIFRIQWGQFIPVALAATGVVFSSSSLGIFINSLLKDTKQGGIVFGGVLTFTGMIGMIRIFAMSSPGAEQLGNTVALLVPQGWGVRGLLQAMNGEPVTAVLLSTLVMLAWSVALFVLGVLRFRRRYA